MQKKWDWRLKVERPQIIDWYSSNKNSLCPQSFSHFVIVYYRLITIWLHPNSPSQTHKMATWQMCRENRSRWHWDSVKDNRDSRAKTAGEGWAVVKTDKSRSPCQTALFPGEIAGIVQRWKEMGLFGFFLGAQCQPVWVEGYFWCLVSGMSGADGELVKPLPAIN